MLINLQKPYISSVEQLTEDVVLVFPAADGFEEYVMDLITSSCGEGQTDVSLKKLAPYKVWCSFIAFYFQIISYY